MTDSFDKRIDAALEQKQIAIEKRALHYPGSPEWENEQAKVEEWDATIRDLRRQAAS